MKMNSMRNKNTVFVLLLFLLIPGLDGRLHSRRQEQPGSGEVHRLLAELKSPHPYIREAAAARLGEIKSPAALNSLPGLLNDPEPLVRIAALQALAAIDPKAALEPAKRLLIDPYREVQISALNILEKQGWKPHLVREKVMRDIILRHWEHVAKAGPAAHDLLLEMLSNNDTAILSGVIRCLGRWKNKRFSKPLLKLLRHPRWRVSYAAVNALFMIEGKNAVTYFAPFMEKMNRLAEDQAHDDVCIRVIRLAAEPGMDKEIVIHMLEAALKNKNFQVSWMASRTLRQLGWKAPDKTYEAIFSIKAFKWKEVAAIGKPAVKPLLDCLNQNEEGEILEEAAKALGKIGGSEVVKGLIPLLRDEKHPAWWAAIHSLKRMKTREAFHVLKDTLATGHERIAGYVAMVLPEFNEPEVPALLIEATGHKSWQVRQGAAYGLEKLAHPDAVTALKKLLTDKKEVADAAKNALAAIRTKLQHDPGKNPKTMDDYIRELKNKDAVIRKNAAQSLDQYDSPRVIQPLLSLLEDSDAGVRERAILSLRKYRAPESVTPLIRLLDDKDPNVCVQALWSLQHFKEPRVIRALCRTIKEDTTRAAEYAGNVLIKMKYPLCRDLLIPLLNAADETVCTRAARVLRHFRTPQMTASFIAQLTDDGAPLEKRSRAAKVLGIIPEPNALKPLIHTLEDKELQMRKEAGWSLIGIHQRMMGEYTMPVPANDKKLLIAQLKKLKGKPEVGILVRALKNPSAASQGIHRGAARILGVIGDPAAVSPLIEAQNHPVTSNRDMAVLALGYFKTKESRENLIALLKNKYCGVRTPAAKSLGNVGGKGVVKVLLEVFHDKHFLNLEVAREQNKARGAFTQWNITRDKRDLKDEILKSLGKLKPPGIFPLLRKALSSNDRSRRNAAVIALGHLKDRRAIQPLLLLLDNLYIKDEAYRSLRKITGKNFKDDKEVWRLWYRKEQENDGQWPK
jgi:HEAT repeat protein